MNYFIIPGIKGKNTLNLSEVILEVLEYTGLTEERLKSKCRTRDLCNARFLVVYYLRSYTKIELRKIANYFGQDHTTIIHAYQTASNLIFSSDGEFNRAIRSIDFALNCKNFNLTRVRPLKD